MQAVFLKRTRKVSRILFQVLLAGLLVLAAVSVRHPNLPKTLVYKVFREYVRVSVNWKTRSWNTIEGKHFIVRFPPDQKQEAALVLETAEEIFQPVNDSFAYRPTGKIPVVLYPDSQSLNRCFGWAADQSAMGVYWAGVIRVLSPKCWIQEPDPAERFKSEGPVAHEYAHLMVDYLAHGNYPRWLTEGIAQQVERQVTGFEMELTGTEEIYPLSEMDSGFDNLANQSAAYRQSLDMVDYLTEQYGPDVIRDMLLELGKGETLNGTFQKLLGVSTNEFEADFQKYVEK